MCRRTAVLLPQKKEKLFETLQSAERGRMGLQRGVGGGRRADRVALVSFFSRHRALPSDTCH